MKQHYDILIVGAGMVGLATALALSNHSLKIGVIEGKMPDFYTKLTDYDLRVIAINQASIEFFEHLDVWKTIAKQRISPFNDMFVWANNSHLHFNAQEIGQPELGFIVENRVIRQTLWQKAEDCDNIDLLCPLQLQTVSIDQQVTVNTKQHCITSQLIIGADGANSWLRQHLDFAIKTQDYGHHALVTIVKTEKPHQKTAWQHFLPSGPLAFLPLDDPHYCSIVWSSTAKQITELKALEVNDFNQQLASAFNNKLGKCDVQATPVSFPLQRQHLTHYVATHVAFVGDAAHRIHPLAGQGANLGFMDAKCLAHTIGQALNKQHNFSTLSILRRYQRERKYYNQKMSLMMDFIKHTFGEQPAAISTLRNMSMDKIEQTSWLKQWFAKQAV